MNLDEYAVMDGVALAQVIARREVSIAEVAEAACTAIAKVNPALNAVIENYDDVFDEAKLGDGPFRGVPYLIKDVSFHFKGRKLEYGSRLCEGMTVDANSYFASLVYRSGVNLIGRSNTPEFSMALCADNLLYGVTNNPWKAGYSTSGSSGGAAAAVAAGLVPIAHASDMGGSTRGPAAWCGTVGLQPSRGRVSAGPLKDEHGNGMAQSFAVTRSMRDTAVMLDCLGLPQPGDPYVIGRPTQPFSHYLNAKRRPLRIGWSAAALMDAPVDAEIARAVERTARALADAGYEVEEASPQIDLPAIDQACLNIWYFGFDTYLDDLGRRAGRKVNESTVGRATLRFYEFARRQTPESYLEALGSLNGFRRTFGQYFTRYDAWLSPTCAQVAQVNGRYGMDIDMPPEEFLIHEQRPCQFMIIYNIAGQPAISLPLALHSNGLPIGIQLGARHAEEDVLIELGSVLEQAMPWSNRLPPTHLTSGPR